MQQAGTSFTFKILVFGLLFALYAAANAAAQYSASIQGTVSDMSGAVVSGAKVAVTNDETQVKRDVTTSKEGFYSVTALPHPAQAQQQVTVTAQTAPGLQTENAVPSGAADSSNTTTRD